MGEYPEFIVVEDSPYEARGKKGFGGVFSPRKIHIYTRYNTDRYSKFLSMSPEFRGDVDGLCVFLNENAKAVFDKIDEYTYSYFDDLEGEV